MHAKIDDSCDSGNMVRELHKNNKLHKNVAVSFSARSPCEAKREELSEC